MATYVVRSATGNDKNPGTGLLPFKTMAKALAMTKANGDASVDTIYVAGNHKATLVDQNSLKIISPNENATFKGSGSEYDNAMNITGHHIYVEGVKFTGAGGSGLKLYSTHDIVIDNTESFNNGTNGYYAWHSTGFTWKNNVAHDNGSAIQPGNLKGSAGFSNHMPMGANRLGWDIKIVGNLAYNNSAGGPSNEEQGFINDGRAGTDYWKDLKLFTGQVWMQDNIAHNNGGYGFLDHFAANVRHDGDFSYHNYKAPLKTIKGGAEFIANHSKNITYSETVAVSDGNHKDDFAYKLVGTTTGSFVKDNVSEVEHHKGSMGLLVSPGFHSNITLNDFGSVGVLDDYIGVNANHDLDW